MGSEIGASAKAVAAKLTTIPPGAGVWFKCRGDQPFNRIFYQRVNSVAYRLWGAGNYRLYSGTGAVGIIRKKDTPNAP